MNKVILIGRLCQDPELKYVGKESIPMANFTIAINRKYRNSQGNFDVDFIDCQLWRDKAETLCKYTTKGNLIGLEGELILSKYVSSSGENVKHLTVRCNSFDFLTPKSKSTHDNIINSSAIFDNEESFDCEVSESEIPF